METLQLFNIELYYSTAVNTNSGVISIEGEECKHILNVMRHNLDDEIYVTNGAGKIFTCQITQINKKSLEANIKNEFKYEERFPKITFCIPVLRNNDRLEFALEKCTELGVTNFIVYKAKRSVARGFNQKRIEKILTSAMKQSLLSWSSKINFANSIEEFASLPGDKIVFEQNSNLYFDNKILKHDKNYFLIFGPEGGLTDEEFSSLGASDKYKLADNRLRSETAIMKAASLL